MRKNYHSRNLACSSGSCRHAHPKLELTLAPPWRGNDMCLVEEKRREYHWQRRRGEKTPVGRAQAGHSVLTKKIGSVSSVFKNFGF